MRNKRTYEVQLKHNNIYYKIQVQENSPKMACISAIWQVLNPITHCDKEDIRRSLNEITPKILKEKYKFIDIDKSFTLCTITNLETHLEYRFVYDGSLK